MNSILRNNRLCILIKVVFFTKELNSSHAFSPDEKSTTPSNLSSLEITYPLTTPSTVLKKSSVAFCLAIITPCFIQISSTSITKSSSHMSTREKDEIVTVEGKRFSKKSFNRITYFLSI